VAVTANTGTWLLSPYGAAAAFEFRNSFPAFRDEVYRLEGITPEMVEAAKKRQASPPARRA
jgi:hypothetical protein